MLLVVGLGNPGKKYAATRHNVGFNVVEALAARHGGTPWRERYRGLVSEAVLPGQRAVLLEPQTYMNLSGESVALAVGYYKLQASDVVVVHDELDVPLGEVRLKVGGGEAGHNGLKSVSRHLGARDYLRLRVGIGRPPKDFRGDISDFVLQAFAPDEGGVISDVIDRACTAIAQIAERGVDFAMNETNRRK